MKKKKILNIIFIIIGAVALFGISGVVAFWIPENDTQRVTLFTSLLFGFTTMIFSLLAISLSVSSYRKELKREREEIENKCQKFINENGDEIRYLPFCIMAYCFDKHHKYKREILNSFNNLQVEVRNEVLKEMNYNLILPQSADWIYKGFKGLEDFIIEMDLGTNILEERDALIKDVLKNSDTKYEDVCENQRILCDLFDPAHPYETYNGNEVVYRKITFYQFLRSYINAKRKALPCYMQFSTYKPIDYFASVTNIENADEQKTCSLYLQMISTITYLIRKEKYDLKADILDSTDCLVTNLEDKLLKLLIDIFNIEMIGKE